MVVVEVGGIEVVVVGAGVVDFGDGVEVILIEEVEVTVGLLPVSGGTEVNSEPVR